MKCEAERVKIVMGHPRAGLAAVAEVEAAAAGFNDPPPLSATSNANAITPVTETMTMGQVTARMIAMIDQAEAHFGLTSQ
mmetsp:Transcript_37967/g.56457  ORF Transcript_37967/g.56457 Transcript_37967/m.56457 type:complete len:80 (-) Transcript_37967:521-760(-)